MASNDTIKRCFLCRIEVPPPGNKSRQNICSQCPPSSDPIYYCTPEHLAIHHTKLHKKSQRKGKTISNGTTNGEEGNEDVQLSTCSG